MANEINDIAKKCKILLLDVEGTTTSISFVKDKLFPYAEDNVKSFLDSEWENEDVKKAVIALRKLAVEDKENNVEGVVSIPGEDASKEDQIEGLVNNVKWQMSSDRKVGALKKLQGLIWKQGFDSGDIKGHVYDDVLSALEQWRSVDDQKVYIYSSGSVQAQKLLFGQSIAGDLLKYIDGHFDTAVGAKQEASSYKAIVEKIGCSADDVLFLTDVVEEAKAAKTAGLYTALVSREGNAPLSDEDTNTYSVIQSLAQLTVSNKRKTEPQDEQPAKVPKTDVNDDVKSATAPTEEKVVPPVNKEEEKMEVDDAAVEESKTAIEEVTDVTESDVPVIDVEPIVTEVDDDQEKKMDTEVGNGSDVTEKSETEKPSSDEEVTKETDEVPKENVVKEDSPIAEETPPAIVTEIEDITNEKESLSDVAEIINRLEPVVEEPETTSEMDDLKNVGEVLEKECDEILSKVNFVANLDNFPLKPLLKPILEDSMDIESEVPTDVVDKALENVVEPAKETPFVSETEKNKVVTESAPEECKNESNAIETIEQNSTSNDPIVAEKSEETNGIVGKIDDASTQQIEEKSENVVKTTEIATEPQADKESKKDTNEETQTEAEKSNETNTESAEATENKSEVQLNGDATNGTAEISQNGVEKDEVNERLSAENGKEENGSNGTNNVQEESKVEEVLDIKVKSLSKEEPLPDPIEQATEA